MFLRTIADAAMNNHSFPALALASGPWFITLYTFLYADHTHHLVKYYLENIIQIRSLKFKFPLKIKCFKSESYTLL